MISKGFKTPDLALVESRRIEDNIEAAVKDVRISLLEADVEISVVRTLIKTKTRCIGEAVNVKATDKSGEKITVKPADHSIRICHEELVNLGPVDTSLVFSETKLTIIMMVGLQGSGKTTTTGACQALIAADHKTLLVAADIYRPAALDQLKVLGERLKPRI